MLRQQTLRDVEARDLPEIHELNRDAVPNVNDIPMTDLEWFLANAHYFRVIAETRVEAFLIGLERGVAYESPNYRFFESRPDAFFYVDRIVVAPRAYRRGHGRRLYDDFAAEAVRRELTCVTCEVNLRPRNDGSLLFHERMGFTVIGTQETEGGVKEVALMSRGI